MVDNAIHRMNHYPADSVVCLVNTYPLDCDLAGGERYPAFKQPGPSVVYSTENIDLDKQSLGGTVSE